MYNFKLTNLDTDSIMIVKPNHDIFPEEEREKLLKELNDLSPEGLIWADDGYYETVIILKAKNYILKKKGEKPTYKGSAIKATLKEAKLKTFIKEVIKEIGVGREDYLTLYNSYAKQIMNITDISEWVTKKTITSVVLKSPRSNESKVRDAIQGTDYREGDKVYLFFAEDNTYTLKENFTGTYNKDTLLKKLYKTIEIFDELLDMEPFLDYSLKKNRKALEELLK